MASTRELTDVQFSTMYTVDNPDHVVAVVGSTSYLGRWDTTKAVYLKPRRDTGQWIGSVQLPANKCMEWKLVVVDMRTKRAVRWEEESNRLLCIKTSNPTSIVVPWNHTGIVVSMGEHLDVIPKPNVWNQRAESPDQQVFTPERLSSGKLDKYVDLSGCDPDLFEKVSPDDDGGANRQGEMLDAVPTRPIDLLAVPATEEASDTETESSSTESDSPSRHRIIKRRAGGPRRLTKMERYGRWMMLGGSLAITFIATVFYYTFRK